MRGGGGDIFGEKGLLIYFALLHTYKNDSNNVIFNDNNDTILVSCSLSFFPWGN